MLKQKTYMIHSKPIPSTRCQRYQVGIEYPQMARLRQQYTAQQAQQRTLAAAACSLQEDALPTLYPELWNRQPEAVFAGPLKNQVLDIDRELGRIRMTCARAAYIQAAYI